MRSRALGSPNPGTGRPQYSWSANARFLVRATSPQCARNLGQQLQLQIWSARAVSPAGLDLIGQPEEQPILAVDRLGLDLGEDRDLRSAARPAGRGDETADFDLGLRILQCPGAGSTTRPCRRTPACHSHAPAQQAVRLERFPNPNHRRLIRPNRYGSAGGALDDFLGRWITGRGRSDTGTRLADGGGPPRILGCASTRTARAQVHDYTQRSSDAGVRDAPATELSLIKRHAGSCAS